HLCWNCVEFQSNLHPPPKRIPHPVIFKSTFTRDTSTDKNPNFLEGRQPLLNPQWLLFLLTSGIAIGSTRRSFPRDRGRELALHKYDPLMKCNDDDGCVNLTSELATSEVCVSAGLSFYFLSPCPPGPG